MSGLSKGLLMGTGSVLLVLGVSFGSWGTWKLMNLVAPADDMALRAHQTQQCKTVAENAGYQVDHQSDTITVTQEGLEDYETRLYQAAWLTQGCEGFVMEAFCIGLSCGEEGAATDIILALKYSDQSIRAN